MLESMARSRFCMIVPGDTQSSERLTDAFVTGARVTQPCCLCDVQALQGHLGGHFGFWAITIRGPLI